MKGRTIAESLLVMSERDTVATAIADLDSGTEFDLSGIAVADERGERPERVRTAEPIDFGHKVALVSMAEGDPVYKYGERIGRATTRIEPGEHVHVHNVESTRGRGDLAREGSA